MQNLVCFNWQGIALQEACWISGKPYFTRRAIGQWLGYNHPRKAVDKIIERNPHITDPRWSTTVKLTAVEGGHEVTRDIEVYDPIGLQLIVFESHQPKALQFKVMAANLVWEFMNGRLVRAQPPRQKLIHAAERLQEIKQLGWGKRGAAMLELGKSLGKGFSTIGRWRKRLSDYGVIQYHSTDAQRRRLKTRFAPTWRKIAELLAAGHRIDDIAKACGVHMVTVYRLRKRLQEDRAHELLTL
jgi:hypothetical protein